MTCWPVARISCASPKRLVSISDEPQYRMRQARALLRSVFRSAASLPLAASGGLDRLDIEEFAGRSKRALEALCRARAQPVYLGGGEALCRILGRHKLYVDPRD